ncbi:putative bifunctional diguanylate cyclase/phosphodiesterase [Saccharospirillum mangrovi]|uniref:putative bifunctional diguanylate cyclase/phosphodiesterase n=1 Tax=Saccharospirillum mangrovi TaxID=2161747 RepID=UPI0013B46CB6|nr:EAL domain-containing protein [Saccharospirillum mangrovi]
MTANAATTTTRQPASRWERLAQAALFVAMVSMIWLGYWLASQWHSTTPLFLELATLLAFAVAALSGTLLYLVEHRIRQRVTTVINVQAVDLLPYPVWIKNQYGRFDHVNAAFLRQLQLPDSPVGKSDADVLPEQLAELFDDADRLVMAQRQMHSVEMKLQSTKAALQWLRLEWHPLFDRDGQPNGVIGTAFDITPYKVADAQLRADQWLDPLTGFANQPGLRSFIERLDDNDATNLWCLHVDIDHFKVLNDSMGGEAGDQLLRQLGTRLSEQSEQGDFLARVAADEFVLFWQGPHEDDHGEDNRDQRLTDLHVQLTQPFNLGGASYSFTVSIGAARSPRHGSSAGELHRNAGVALFNAKKLGRNQVHWYHSGYEDQAQRRLNKAQTLTRALQQHDMEIHLQPRIDCRTGQIEAMECLVRLQNEGGDLIYPGHFIDLAEHNGSIRELDRWVLEQTLMLLARQLGEGAQPVVLGVNFSVQSVNRDTLHYLRAWHERQPDVLRYLEVEVTEHQLPEQNFEFRDMLLAFRELGVTLALDDFGTGYANLSRLPDLPFQVVKLDRTFIHDLPQSEKQMAVVKAVVDLCQSLSIQVVAEGVETEAELNAVADLGCHLIQGFVYAKPRPLGEAIEWFEQRRLSRQ